MPTDNFLLYGAIIAGLAALLSISAGIFASRHHATREQKTV